MASRHVSAASHRVLLVDDRAANRESTRLFLKSFGYAVDEAASVPEALARLRQSPVEVVFSDVRMNHDDDGLELLRRIKVEWPWLPVVLYTGWATPEDAVRAMKLGADDYLGWPLPSDTILETLRRAVATRPCVLRTSDAADSTSPGEVIAASAAAVLRWVHRTAPTDSAVLIVGETGTGKELVAHTVHAASTRSRGPFVPVNCGAIPAGLFESELFGYRKSAFTSATTDKMGLVEEADRGTLFLDEIGELPLAMQAALLRFLDHGELRRLGDTRVRRVNARVIAATNRPLAREMEVGHFRADLYYRLAVATCRIPPLRERPEDLEAFVEQWCAADSGGGGVRVVTPDAVARLREHQWPGNLRELRNLLERAALLASNDVIGGSEVDLAIDDGPLQATINGESEASVDERTRLRLALESQGWRIGRTAAHLGISRVTLWRHIRSLGVRRRS